MLPQSASEKVSITSGDGKTTDLPARQLEDILSPTLFIWPGRSGVVVPIGHAYANELLGTSNQSTFSFLANRDAAFLSRRAYVNSPRTASIMRPDSPIVFYESKRSGGRGAALAIARIADVIVARKSDIPSDGKRRLVVDSVDEFSSSDDVLLTTFDNLFVLPSPVSLEELKKIGAAGNANLISAVSLSSDQITQILTLGWPSKNAK